MTPMLVTLRDIVRGHISQYVVLGVDDSEDGRKRAVNAAKQEHGHDAQVTGDLDPVKPLPVSTPFAVRIAAYITDPPAVATRSVRGGFVEPR